MDFSKRVVLITGGSSGIGLAIAGLMAGEGACLWLLSRSQPRLEAALKELHEIHPAAKEQCHIICADVANADQVARAISQITEKDGLPDLVINSAGMVQPGYIQDLSLDDHHRMMDANYFGTVNVTKAVLPGMIARRSGHIVNVSSSVIFFGLPGYSAYMASKLAVRGFSDVLRAEMGPFGIRVSLVLPGDTDTPQLEYENKFKPPETKEVAGMAKVMSADAAAREIVKGIERGKYMILLGADIKFWYRLSSLLGDLSNPVIDWLLARARRKIQENSAVETGNVKYER